MKFSTARFAVTAGLAASLALAGCSFSASSETTTSVSDGETTTTTTTTTSTEEGTKTTTETTTTGDQNLADLKSYALSDFGIRYELPEGFKFTEANTDLDISDTVVAFQATDDDKCSAFLRFIPSEEQPDVWGEQFLNDMQEQAKTDVQNGGGTVKSAEQGKLARSDKEFPVITVEAEAEGTTSYMEILYFSINDGEGGYAIGQLVGTGNSKDAVDTIIGGLTVE